MDLLSKLAGTKIYLPTLGTIASQPTIREIAMLGEQTFFDALAIFSASTPEVYKAQILKSIPEEEKAKVEAELNYSIQSGLDVFSKYCLARREQLSVESYLYLILADLRTVKWVKLSPTKITIQLIFALGEEKKVITLNEAIFDELQDFVKESTSYQTQEDAEKALKPAGKLAQAIADKMAAAALRREKIYGKKKSQEGESSIGTMCSILATSDGIPITEVLKLTFLQVLIQLNRTQLFQQYRTQMTLSAFAGIDADDIINWQSSL